VILCTDRIRFPREAQPCERRPPRLLGTMKDGQFKQPALATL
jgi:hypothetical protein